MADFSGFVESYASDILRSKISPMHYIGLGMASSAPNSTGGNFVEPSASNGYKRSKLGTLNTDKAAQIANEDIIFFNESINAGYGTVGYFGLFLGEDPSEYPTPYFVGKLTDADGEVTTKTIGAEYVPIFRAKELIIGLDKKELETY
jgi:hypothetical protein